MKATVTATATVHVECEALRFDALGYAPGFVAMHARAGLRLIGGAT